MKQSISRTYDFIFRFKSHPHIEVTKDQIIYNQKTGRFKRVVVNGRSKGLWLDSKTFITNPKLNDMLELIPKEYAPF